MLLRNGLKQFQAASDLGAGFQLATHDLEIRGAGELLGEDQSGNMQTIGFSLYMEMLDEAVTAIFAKVGHLTLIRPNLPHAEVDLKIPALIPNDYLNDVPLRLELYKRISICISLDRSCYWCIEWHDDQLWLATRQVKNLFFQARVRCC